MPKGLKETSSLITIGFSALETAPDTYLQERVDLQLNPLDNEVFVVTAIDMDLSAPNAIAGTNTAVNAQVTTTSQSSIVNLSATAALAISDNQIRASGFVDGGVAFQKTSMETPPAALEYIGIIATNDFFVGIKGTANGTVKRVAGKMYGYRARADSAVYAALVQSEVLSS